MAFLLQEKCGEKYTMAMIFGTQFNAKIKTMQHFILRCKHCKKEYTYCTYGNGPEYGTEEGCSCEYCGECQKAIDNALGNIPVKFSSKFKEITPSKELLDLFNELKEKYKPPKENRILVTKLFNSRYDNIDTCVHNGRHFHIEWNDDTPNDIHVSIEMEFDNVKNEYTGKYWRKEENDNYTSNRSNKWKSIYNISDIPIKPLPEPSGKFYFDGLCEITHPTIQEWDIITTKEEKKPSHELQTYTRKLNGNVVESILNGTSTAYKGINISLNDISTIYDFMDYELTFEKYLDEQTETLIKIKLI